MKAANDNNEKLNPEAIYAAMVFLREYADSPQGQQAFNDLLEKKESKVSALRSLMTGTRGVLHIRPVFQISDDTIEEIYPGEPDSVTAGIELGRTVIWGPPGAAGALLQPKCPEHDPINVALSRFISDRAN